MVGEGGCKDIRNNQQVAAQASHLYRCAFALLLHTHLLSSSHKTTDESSNKSAANVADILGHKPDGRSHLSGDGNGKLGVGVGFIVIATRGNHVIIDIAGLHTVEHIEQENAVTQRVVLETADGGSLAALLGHAIGPGDHIGVAELALAHTLSKSSEGVEDILAHELPDHAEGESALTISNIGTLDTNKREAVLLADFDGVVCVFHGLEAHELVSVGGTLVAVAPLYRARNDLVVCLKKNGTVAEVIEEGNNGRLDVQTVEPESKDASLALTLSVKVFNISLLFFSDRVETGVGVEQVGDESKVELGVSSDE